MLRDLKAGESSDDQASKRLERSPYWVWTAMDPNSKLLLVIDVGTRTLEMAQRVVHQVVQRLAPGCVPLCFTDGLKDYGTAFLTHFGQWRQPARRRDKGPLPQPRWMPLPQLLYAQVVKSYRRRRLVGIKYRVVFGTMERVKQILAACGWKEDQYGLCGETEPRHSPAGGGSGPSGQHTMPRRRGPTAAGDGVPRLLQFLPAACEFAPAPVGA